MRCIYLGSRPVVVLSDNAVIAHLLRDRPYGVRRSSRMASMIEESVARGLFTAEGEEWRTQRRLAMRALTLEVVHHFFPTLVTLTERLLRRWRGELVKGRPVDVLRDLKAWTLDVTVGLAQARKMFPFGGGPRFYTLTITPDALPVRLRCLKVPATNISAALIGGPARHSRG